MLRLTPILVLLALAIPTPALAAERVVILDVTYDGTGAAFLADSFTLETDHEAVQFTFECFTTVGTLTFERVPPGQDQIRSGAELACTPGVGLSGVRAINLAAGEYSFVAATAGAGAFRLVVTAVPA